MTDQPHHTFNESDYQHLLDSMFVQQNEALWEKLRDQIAEENLVDELSKATAIQDKALIEKLIGLGIRPRNMAALTMYPLISVAYADGVLNIEERDLIMKMAQDWNMAPGDPAFEVMNHWLKDGPTAEGLAVWKEYITAVMSQMTPEQVADLKQSIMSRATAVATAVGDVLGRFGNRTTKSEDARLKEIEAVFP
ncbi:hypothetical protein DTL21_03580 [Bremerella cremea]|uniref:TerB family tellurite resistance protein n=1 Tax=Blastopirellula marina TaxID=124 RepID=A0A2S8G5Z7_9BACT|nr:MULTISPECIES: hypothetical protein [Pirellulaceae]PQO39833.1 hypothetical protein C5Y83_03580 [Blastopirellula marina]RCS51299.1 hypothetical protein DTL21_03580 [Bremerella cremea]